MLDKLRSDRPSSWKYHHNYELDNQNYNDSNGKLLIFEMVTVGKKVTQLLRLCPLPYHHDEQNHNSNYCHHCHCFYIFMCGTYIWGNYHHHLAKEVTKSQVLEHPPKPENFSRALQRRRRLFWRGWSWMWKSAWSVDVCIGSIVVIISVDGDNDNIQDDDAVILIVAVVNFDCKRLQL